MTMRSTYYSTLDKVYLSKAFKLLIFSYIALLAYIGFFNVWVDEAVGMLHDETHDNSILGGIIINLIFSLILIVTTILATVNITEYKSLTVSSDKLSYAYKVLLPFSAILTLMIIIFSVLNSGYLLSLL